jgi:hypothetical protein
VNRTQTERQLDTGADTLLHRPSEQPKESKAPAGWRRGYAADCKSKGFAFAINDLAPESYLDRPGTGQEPDNRPIRAEIPHVDPLEAPTAFECRGICGNCQHARAPTAHELERWGVPLKVRAPAMVRRCAVHSPAGGVQLVQTWHSCQWWEPRA